MVTLDLLSLLCLVGAVALVLMAVALAPSKSLPQGVFAMFAMTMAAVIGGTVTMDTHVLNAWPHFARVHIPFNFLLAPLFYLFARAVAQGGVGRRALSAVFLKSPHVVT